MYRKPLASLLFAFLSMIAVPDVQAASIVKSSRPAENRYIVVLRDGAVRQGAAGLRDARPSLDELSTELAGRGRGRVRRQFGAALKGFAFEGDRQAAEALANDPRVAYVEEDGWVEVSGQASPPSWGLDRVDQRSAGLDAYYDFHADGAVVDVYVVDTGIRSTHVDFEGRVDLGVSYSAIDDGLGTEDCHGHGTHVAGIIGGASYGVAKAVTLHPVRVLDCEGRGLHSDLVAGVDWITSLYAEASSDGSGGGGKGGGGGGGKGGKNARQSGSTSTSSVGAPAVVNMSLATTRVSALADAIENSMALGIVYVAAAGNDGADACSFAPAYIPGVITVGASDASDSVAAYSNRGSCVDLFAPGSSIVSSFLRSDTDALAMSGTSMAAPHVAGAAALLLSVNPALTPAEVATLVNAAATQGRLANAGTGSPDRLLFAPFTGWDLDMAPVATFAAACVGGTCSFDAAGSADDRGILGHDWDLGNGRTASGETVSVRYGKNGPTEVTVTLTLTDTSGQTSTVSRTLTTR